MLNGHMDDDDDDSDDAGHGQYRTKQAEALPDKHAALAAATGITRQETLTPPPQYIAAPRPGYAAPIAALNLAKPQPVAIPAGRTGSQEQHSPNLQVNTNRPMYAPGSPISIRGGTPHPLDPPMSPITPAFARPRPPKGGDVHFDASQEKQSIMRGNTEETMLPKRGDAGDDFWRRFSMVAKEENRRSPTSKQRYCFFFRSDIAQTLTTF